MRTKTPRTTTLVIVLLTTVTAVATAQIGPDRWAEIDTLHDRDRHDTVLQMLAELEVTATTPAERAAVLWRRARAEFSRLDLALYTGDLGEDAAMEQLEEIQATADAAVQAGAAGTTDRGAGGPAQAYFWRGAARAKYGELRGVLNALFMADDLREDLRSSTAADPAYGNPYYVAGQLYHLLPGFPISFGDGMAAVSFSRRAVDLHDAAYDAGAVDVRYWDYYVRLAENLLARGSSQRRRDRQVAALKSDYAAAEDAFERGMYYEAVADVPRQSDEEEAQELLQFVINGLESQATQSVRDRRTLEDAYELRDE
ncbi:MAG: hypothetical protein PF508_09555 [Spirochaeta sp.]|jgi:hypothetical protein|nr:hypothetical protein [Spirochaeta sp.]